jgi:hypothetical protein
MAEPLTRLGFAACAAALCSCARIEPLLSVSEGPALRNAAFVEVDVSVRHAEAVDCESVIRFDEIAEGHDFVKPFEESLGYDDAVRLTRGEVAPPCGAAWVSGSHFSAWLVSWDLRNSPDLMRSTPIEGEVDPGNIYLELWGTELRPAVGPGMQVWVLDE